MSFLRPFFSIFSRVCALVRACARVYVGACDQVQARVVRVCVHVCTGDVRMYACVRAGEACM